MIRVEGRQRDGAVAPLMIGGILGTMRGFRWRDVATHAPPDISGRRSPVGTERGYLLITTSQLRHVPPPAGGVPSVEMR